MDLRLQLICPSSCILERGHHKSTSLNSSHSSIWSSEMEDQKKGDGGSTCGHLSSIYRETSRAIPLSPHPGNVLEENKDDKTKSQTQIDVLETVKSATSPKPMIPLQFRTGSLTDV